MKNEPENQRTTHHEEARHQVMKKTADTDIQEIQRKTIEVYSKMLEQANRNAEEKIKALSLLRQLGDSLLCAQDLKKICKVILEVIVGEFDAKNCCLMLLDKKKNELKVYAAMSQMEEGVKYFDDSDEILFSLDESIASLASSQKQSILLPATEKDDRFIPRPGGHVVRSILCVPLIVKGDVLGVINLSSPVPETLSEKDERVMKIVSDQAALAIENSLLIRDRVRSERMSAIGNMAATIIHDIKNPMGIIQGYSEIMAEPDTSLEEREEYAQVIKNEIGRFVAMTEELLEFARGGESRLNIEAVTVSDFIKSITPFLERDFAEKNIVLETFLEYNPTIDIDFQKFQRVLFNIAGNAREAMPEGGKLTIRSFREGEKVALSIHDTGIGIPGNLVKKIFSPFVTHGKAKGTGLGLAIVKKIVEDHKGNIAVTSEEGSGTEFTIKLNARA